MHFYNERFYPWFVYSFLKSEKIDFNGEKKYCANYYFFLINADLFVNCFVLYL